MSAQPQEKSGSAVVVGVFAFSLLSVLALAMAGQAFGAVGGGWVVTSIVVAVIILVAAVVDLVQLVDARNTPWGTIDLFWLFAIVLLGFVGPIVWLVSGRKHFATASETEGR